MKTWITEYIDDKPGVLVGPYIRAATIVEASRIAIEYDLYVIGEIHELKHNELRKKRTVH